MIKKLWEDQKPLLITGAAHFTLFIVLAIIAMFDSEEILGVDRWIKPMKFAISIAIYVGTLAIYLVFINGRKRAKSIIAWGTIAMMVGEMVLITMQAARGTTSHFNVFEGGFNALVFSVMGLMILTSSLFAAYLLYLYFRAEISLPKSIVRGIRLGVVLLLLASIEGGFMSAILRHSVGVEDGGPGLPLVNWSTRGGDLRAAHFVGMHAFQAIPLAAYTLERYRVKAALPLVAAFAFLYFVLFTGIFVQALMGLPLLGGMQ